jgi:hypothetical protein
MDTFDIRRLTDFDFEAICKDIFETVLGLHLEIFAPGRDQGIDLRHMASPAQGVNDIIIQCKHWERTRFSTLYSHLKNKELPKIKRLDPKRYILATSVDMSVRQKDTLLNLLTPYVKSAKDILNISEVESLLRSNPQIVQRHMRLWLSSSATLQAMFSKSILIRSGDLADDVKFTMLVYVPNDSFNRASELLESRRVCIIAGVPGIGKTTLAEILTVSYADMGYDIFEISEDADEINSVWDDNAAQFFYYDDFLGQNSLEDRLHKNEDSRLVKIIRRINKSPNKRFVLTTREYILEQAKRKYERLAGEDLNPLTCVLTLDDYTPLIRAEILYNHLYFSRLTREEKAQFADPEVYLPIINHRNFNPRLIDYSLRLIFSPEDETSLEVSQIMHENLDNPRRIWEHIIDNQLDQASIDILIVLFSFTREVALSELELALNSYYAQDGRASSHRTFLQSLKILDNTMIRVGSNSGESTVAYHSPSIRDYMGQYIAENPDKLSTLIGSVLTFDQIHVITSQSTGPARTELHMRLRQAATEVEAAVRRTSVSNGQESSGAGTWNDERFKQVIDTIYIANTLQADSLADIAADWLSDLDIHRSLPDPSDLVNLLKKLWESSSQRLAGMRESLRDAAVEYFFEDVSDWDNADYTRSILAELGDIAPDSSRETIEEIMFRRTEESLERFARYDQGEPHFSRSLEEMVEHAQSYADPEEVFPGYSEAAAMVESRRASQHEMESHKPSVSSGNDGTDYNQIYKMLGSLAEGTSAEDGD